MEEYIPENNLVVLFLLILLTAGLYYFWWLARTSRVFGDDPVMNIVLTVFTAGLWSLYVNLRYMQKSEMINGRDAKWYMILFVFLSPIIIQHNINEKYFPGR
jgi:apolipoprotein N-acyltransferase